MHHGPLKQVAHIPNSQEAFLLPVFMAGLGATASQPQQNFGTGEWTHASDVALLTFLRSLLRQIEHRKAETLESLDRLSASATDLHTDLARTATTITLLSDERFLEKVGRRYAMCHANDHCSPGCIWRQRACPCLSSGEPFQLRPSL